MAVWLAREPECPTDRAISVNSPTAPTEGPAAVPPPDRDLIGVLADLVVGDRKEQDDGRRS
jgi:hypothetical protein